MKNEILKEFNISLKDTMIMLYMIVTKVYPKRVVIEVM